MTSFKTDGKAILIITIGALIAIAFLATIADSVFEQTNTITVVNTSVTAPAVNVSLDLAGRELITLTNVTNETIFPAIIGAGAALGQGLTIETATSSTTGLRTVRLILNDSVSAIAGTRLNVSYTANPDGYLSDLSSRAVTLLIVIFGSLAILVFVIIVFIKDGSMGRLIGRG